MHGSVSGRNALRFDVDASRESGSKSTTRSLPISSSTELSPTHAAGLGAPRRYLSPDPTRPRHRIEFPPPNGDALDQDEAFFHLANGSERTKIRFHDYSAIYARPGLYEQLFYDRLKCRSPAKVAAVLEQSVRQAGSQPSALRVLDLGGGNGMAAEALAAIGVSRIVGVDIIEEARDAAYRDRPGIYDHYYVADFTDVAPDVHQELAGWSFDCLVSVAALGFGDIPPKAMATALDLVELDGWIAFNIKDTFLDASDVSGFSTFVRELIFSEYLDLFHLERYQHRLSIDGEPLNYFAIVGRKAASRFPPAVRALLDEQPPH